MNEAIDPRTLRRVLAAYLPIYRAKLPTYQAQMLNSLRDVWIGPHESLLDVGGGTGVIAQAVSELFPVGDVHAVDMVDRFAPGLSVQCRRYDGKRLPYDDKSFDAAMLNNVVHHVPVDERGALLSEIRRVVRGPVYLKDHEQLGFLDNARLAAMDAIGNIPFGGMVWARYLTPTDWIGLVKESGYRIAARAAPMQYRRGFYAAIFPNRLEITLRLDPS